MKEYIFKIKRCKSKDSKAYWQSFKYSANEDDTVSLALELINSDPGLKDTDGNPAEPIAWDYSCLQGACGNCGMVINGTPALACKTRLSDLKTNIVTLEPLSKFPLIKDLSVNKDAMHSLPAELGITDNEDCLYDEKNYQLLYETAKCLKCGLCVEVCPNAGLDRRFAGAFITADCYLEYCQSSDKGHKKDIRNIYGQNVEKYCSKSLGCAAVCPVGIDIKKLLTRMNRAK